MPQKIPPPRQHSPSAVPLPCCQVIPCALVVVIVIGGVAIHGCSQPSGPAHRGAVEGVDDAADEAYLVRLVGFAIHPGMRPGKVVPAAHFDKALEDWTCHICHEVFDFSKASSNYSVSLRISASFLDISHGIKASAWSHYLVTVGGVT